MTQRDVHGLYIPPRQTPNYAAAVASGVVPSVPDAPARLLAGRTADSTFKVFLLRGALLVLGVLLALEVLPRQGVSTGVTSVVVLGLCTAAGVVLHQQWRAVGRRLFVELEAGYTTLVFTYASFAPPADRRWHETDGRVAWDYRGVWVLRANGQVVSAPNRGVDPPGCYPSPQRRGAQELWSGAAWTGQFR